ncbi:MAG TPA: hypothetical protein VF160_04885 [Candidatus Dormibacteraeota bacterium]
MRQPILYAEEMWRRQRFWAVILVVLGIAVSVYLYLFSPVRRWDQGTIIWLLYIPSGLLLGGVLLYYRRRHYIHAREDALRISNLLSAVDIDYDAVRSVHVKPLEQHFQESHRRRYRHPMAKPYMDKPALFIRLRKDHPATAGHVRKLGLRLAYEDTIALPVPDPDAAAWEITSRLPARAGQNLGGKRRRKRR